MVHGNRCIKNTVCNCSICYIAVCTQLHLFWLKNIQMSGKFFTSYVEIRLRYKIVGYNVAHAYEMWCNGEWSLGVITEK